MSSERAQLFIGNAIEEGWTAFRRAPWSFVGFVLLTGVLSQLFAVVPLPVSYTHLTLPTILLV